MIEEIKKEILEKTDSDVYDTLIVQYNDVIEILDKYNNQDNKIDILEDIISTIRDFKENDIEAICKVLLNKYRNICGNCLKCDYFTLAKFKNAWEELINPYKELYKQCKTEKEFIILGMSGVSGLLERAEEIETKHGIKENKDVKDKR